MTFKKGYTPWNKGKSYMPKNIELLKLRAKQFKKGDIPCNKGKTYEESYGIERSLELKNNLSNLSKSNHKFGGKNNSTFKKGHIVSDVTRQKIREGVSNHIRDIGGPRIGNFEPVILDNLEKSFYPFRILRQYSVAGYFLDGYIPAFKLAIEIDEKYHKGEEQLQKDINRQQYIEKNLGCKFLRIEV